MKNSIVRNNPVGHNPLAESREVQEILDNWKKAGLEPVEVSEEDLVTIISITAALHTGEMTWDVQKADGLRALAIMAIATKSMFEEYFKGSARPKLSTNSPDTKIAIQLENNEVTMAYDRNQNPMVLKGLLLACLWKLIDQCKEEGHPLDIFTGLLKFDVDE